MMIPILKRILFVEDDPDIQVVGKLALEEVGGFTVEICCCGNEAIRKAPIFVPDLIVLDVMMPGMDGLTTLTVLRSIPQTATTPIIFITAKVQMHEVEQYKAMGVVDVIAKPFDPMKISSTINVIWERYHGG